ncbi:MAG: protein kinase [Myxococcales bacterium]|nr:protein kinase [Myxococcales bacterium]
MRFGAWEVEAELGRGGMGVVYAAAHPDGRRAALKVLLHSSPRLRAGLWREVFALGRVRHPQIVQILDHGEEGDVPWIAMALVEGRTLREGVSLLPHGTPTFDLDGPDEQPLPVGGGEGMALQEALDVLAALCHPLATLHGAGLVHQDVKLENVMVRDGVPVLLDLGLSAVAGARDRLRGAGSSRATPTTVSPEQVLGDVVDARADLYALGCVAFELLTGRPPFTGSVGDVLTGHLERPPPLVSELAPDVPGPVCEIVDALLRKDRRTRPGHAMVVESVLVAAGAAPPPSRALPPPPAYLYRPTLAGPSEVADRLRGMARRGGARAVVVARSGHGKTRLLLEAATEARGHGVAVVAVDCTAAEQGGTGPVVRLLERIGELSAVAGGAEWWDGLGPMLVQVAPSLIDVTGVSAVPRPRVLEPQANADRLVETLVELLVRASAKLQLAVLVDDLQWGSALLRQLTRRLADRAEVGWTLIAAWREEEEDDELRTLRGTCAAFAPSVLERDQVVAILGEMLGAPPPEELVAEVHSAAAGSALWVTELARGACHAGRLVRRGEGWELLPGPALVASAAAVIELRITGLETSVREVLERAAVQGRWIDTARLGLPDDQVSEGLRALAQRGLVEDDGRRLVFTHDQLREGVLLRLPRERLVEHHRALAQAIGRECAPELLETLARHLSGADDPGAAETYVRAAQWMEERFGDASDTWARALACSDGPSLETVRRRLSLVKGLARRGGERLQAQLQILRDEVAALGDPRAQSALLEAEVAVAQLGGDRASLLDLARRGVAACGPDDRARRLRLSLVEAVALRQLRRNREAVEVLREALSVAEPGDAVCGLWCARAVIHASSGEVAEARTALEHAEASALGMVDEVQTINVRMIVEQHEPEIGRQWLPRVERVVEALMVDAPADWWSNLAGNAAALHYGHGQYEDALRVSRIAVLGSERTGAHLRSCYAWYYIGHALRAAGGDLDEAQAAAERVVALGQALGSPADIADGWCLQGQIALARGEDARPYLERARSMVEGAEMDLHTREVLSALEGSIERALTGKPLWRGTDPGTLTPLQLERALSDGLDPRWAELDALSRVRPGPA